MINSKEKVLVDLGKRERGGLREGKNEGSETGRVLKCVIGLNKPASCSGV